MQSELLFKKIKHNNTNNVYLFARKGLNLVVQTSYTTKYILWKTLKQKPSA
jgi:hypothetical protein